MSVYFITCRQANAVKIGNSLDPHARLSEMQTGCPHELRLEGMVAGEYAVENDLHARFADAHIRREWFALTREIEALIAANPPGPKPARPRVSNAKPLRRPIIFGETAREYEQRLENERLAAEREAGKRWLEQQARNGKISFPFRQSAAGAAA
jgi:hypothetical protein